jgi:hypothetical protein
MCSCTDYRDYELKLEVGRAMLKIYLIFILLRKLIPQADAAGESTACVLK